MGEKLRKLVEAAREDRAGVIEFAKTMDQVTKNRAPLKVYLINGDKFEEAHCSMRAMWLRLWDLLIVETEGEDGANLFLGSSKLPQYQLKKIGSLASFKRYFKEAADNGHRLTVCFGSGRQEYSCNRLPVWR